MRTSKKSVKDFSEMPGPRGIPLVGSALSMKTYSSKVLMQWSKEHYGNVFRYRMFTQDCVALNGYETIKEGLVENGDDMSGRISGPLSKATRDERGLFFLDYGELWKKWKPFVTNAVSSIMQGLDKKIEKQAGSYLSEVAGLIMDDEPVDIKELIRYRMAQISFISFLDKEFSPHEKGDLLNLISDIYTPFKSIKFAILMFSPILSAIPPFTGYLATEKSRRERVVGKFVRWIEKYHSKSEKSRTGCKNITDVFFEENSDPDYEDLEQLALLLIDWVFAGTSTVTEQIMWVFLLLLKHPDMLEEVQIELDKAMESTPSVAELFRNEEKVPFFMAVIEEALRLRPIAPGSLYHRTVSETVVGGYKIPKDVVVIPNLWSVHHDPEIWAPDPESFRPDRHLDKDGKFKPSKFVMPFSIGNRKCAAGKIAKANIFMFLSSTLLRYKLSLAEESEDVDLSGISTALLQAPDFKIVFRKRKSI